MLDGRSDPNLFDLHAVRLLTLRHREDALGTPRNYTLEMFQGLRRRKGPVPLQLRRRSDLLLAPAWSTAIAMRRL